MKKIYAVKIGRQTGLFSTWAACEKQVKGYPGAKFKGFASAQEAAAWLAEPIRSVPSAKSSEKKSVSKVNSPSKAVPRENAPTTSFPETDADYIIYTDGSCLRNPDGPGGWAAVILNRKTGEVEELHEGSPSTTNNRMELSAAIGALSAIEENASVALYTDSQYMKNAFTRHWLDNWKRNAWKTSKGTDVLNQDLWLELDALFQKHQVSFHWVKGHAGNSHNERCDMLARSEAMKYQ